MKDGSTESSTRGVSTLWIVLLTGASFLLTMALACMMPFASLAALAATQMRRRDGFALILLTWGIGQAVGFGFKHYPLDATTVAWGLALGLAALAAVAVGQVAAARMAAQPVAFRLAGAFASGFVAFKLVLLVASFGLGGTDTATSMAIIAPQFALEAAIAVGLLLLYHGLVAIGVPAAPRRVTATA